jgi:aminopeptidase N
MKNLTLLLLLSFSTTSLFSQYQCSHKNHKLSQHKSSSTDNLRSDTIDILNYTVNLDLTVSQTISGSCSIDFVTLQNNVNSLSLDLLKLSVDSIKQNSQNLSFNYNDTLLLVQLTNTLSQNDTTNLTVYYHGAPQGDPSGWGGWYFSGNYSYNLGVGFQDNPHNYGRVWHPCFDNFVERSTYLFNVKTDTSKSVHCNGLLINESTSGAVKTTTWQMNQEIPTYLACIATGNYTTIHQTYNSNLTSSSIPIYLSAQANDTVNLKNSFANLNGAMTAFENNFGPYFWDKIGYSLVPFNAGAMEHATNIAYPIYAADGSLGSETLMAHELAHHWWGNLVTCKTAEDMWINEGMASYCERLFLEHIYGYDSYINSIRANHKEVLHHAHINDESFLALHEVPHEFTYGDHSYNKGADVAHTLRSYMGDTEYFTTMTNFLNDNKFKAVDAYDLRNYINNNSSVNVTDFFNDWIFNPGFPQFSIDSVKTINSGSTYTNTVFIKQKLRAAPNYFSNVPLDITFKSSNWSEETFSFVMNGANNSFQFTTSFAPVLSFLNGADKISQGVTAENQTLTSTGIKNFSYSFFRTDVNNISDSAYIKVEHNWVAPDDFKDGDKDFLYDLSTERYWNVTGILPTTFDASIRLKYNGRNTNAGNLDTQLTSSAGYIEDSMVLFHRSNPSEDWEVVTNCTFNSQGSNTDGSGRVDVDEFKFGQYTFGWKQGTVAINEINKEASELKITPNIVSDFLSIETNSYNEDQTISIIDVNGKEIYSGSITNSTTLNIENWSKGSYFVVLLESGVKLKSKQFIKN